MIIKEDVKTHFNNIAHIYDKFKNRNQYYYDNLKALISKIAKKYPYNSVLDVGCGTGEILNFLNPKRGIGIDISSEMIFFAKNKFKKYSFFVSDFSIFSLEEKFDLILIIDVIEHFDNLNKLFSKLKNFSNKNTKIIISSPSYYWKFILFLGEKIGMKMPEGSHKWIPPRTLRNMILKYDFKIIDSGYMLIIPKKIPFLSYLINSVFYKIPIIKNLGSIYYIVCDVSNRE